MPEKSYIGKYVCYNSIDGGACWGCIKSECKINTMNGLKEAFILDGRLVRYLRSGTGITLKVGNPQDGFRTMTFNGTNPIPLTDSFFEVKGFKGDTLLRKDSIDLERDIIDFKLEDFLCAVNEETLFLAVLAGRDQGVFGTNALELGLMSIMGTDSVSETAKQVLRKRLEQRNEQ